MTSFLYYLLHVNCVFAVLVLFYYLSVRKLSFHTANRWLLLSFIPVSLLIPKLKLNLITWRSSSSIVDEPAALNEAELEVLSDLAAPAYFLQSISILEMVYSLGALFLFGRLLFQLVKLFNTRLKAKPVSKGNNSFFRVDTPAAFSAFNWIFIPKDEDPNKLILKHEEAHVKLFHTLDLLLAELFIALSWFNPFVFLFRKQLKCIHEYQADEYVLTQNVKTSDYLRLMADHLIPVSHPPLSSHFKSITIKNRIEMITKHKSAKPQLLRYLSLLPIGLLMVFIFSSFKGSKPSIFPIKNGEYKSISSRFGNRTEPKTKTVKLHGGIDISAKAGTNIMATGGGVVKLAKMHNKWGNLVIIDHGDGYETWYAHMQGIDVQKGDPVKTGTTIGRVGNTGLSFGPHLHYEVRLNGKRLNPEKFYTK